MIRYFLILIFLLTTSIVFSQRKKEKDTSEYIVQPNRIEFPIDRINQEFNIVNGYDDGLLVVIETTQKSQGGFSWVLHKLDTTLEIVWTKLILNPSSYTLKGWDYSLGYYYLLYSIDQYKPEKLSVFKISTLDGKYDEIKLTTVFPLNLAYFEVVNGIALLGGTTNYKPAILTFDLEDQKPRVIPGIYEDNNDIVDVSMDREEEAFTISMIEQLKNKQLTIRVNTYTLDNLLIQTNIINPGDKRNLIDGAATSFDNGFQYVAGTYSKKSYQYSKGIYLTKFVNGRQQFIKYHNYADLDRFFEYLSKGRQSRIKDRIKKRKVAGKSSNFSYRLMIHDIINRGNEYILIGEAYYPRYSNSNVYIPYSTYRSGNNIVGYKYTHAVIVSFDQNGDILWNHSFPIEDVYTYYADEKVTVNVLDEYIELLYLERNEIRSKLIKDDKVIEGPSYTPVQLTSDIDQIAVRDPDEEGLEKWYQDALYAYGEQHITNKIGLSRESRKIFYINKIRYNFNQYTN